jgi:hypothetical protein
MGLPTETSHDVDEIIELVKRIKHGMVKNRRPGEESAASNSASTVLFQNPLPRFSGFPWRKSGSLKKKQQLLKKKLVKSGGIVVNSDVPKWAYVQALLSLGDRRVGTILQNAHRLNGNWKKAMQHSQINPDFFVYRSKALDERLPWDFIDHGITKNISKRNTIWRLMENYRRFAGWASVSAAAHAGNRIH